MTPDFDLIIITKNRPLDLEKKILPSLLAQKSGLEGCEVCIYDASTDEATQKLVARLAPLFEERGARLTWHQAHRPGTASQRNDALRVTSAPFVAFLDDDCVLSPDAIASLRRGFDQWPGVMGFTLRLTDDEGRLEKPSLSQRLLRPLPHGRLTHRRMKALGGLAAPHEIAGEAYTLCSGNMALRRQAFDLLTFDERLQHFSPYAFGEDRLLSAGLVKLTKKAFIILPWGWAWHQPNPAPRAAEKGASNAVATQLFNRWFIWRSLTNWPRLLGPFFWVSFYFRYRKMVRQYGRQTAREGLQKALRHKSELEGQGPITLGGGLC